MSKKLIPFLLCGFLFFSACASSTGIFPAVDLSTSEASLVLPNPISITTDVANNQIVVANSNVDILYDTGSMAVLGFDATDTNAPQLSATKLISAPNFATQIYNDGAGSLFVPFREAYTEGSSYDTIVKYTLTDGNIVKSDQAKIYADPFGITGSGANLFIVADDYLQIITTDLSSVAKIDLTQAESSGLDDTDSENVLSVAYDATNELAVVSNIGGTMFVIDTNTNELIQTIEGPESTRDILINDNRLYVLEAITETVMVFNMNELPAATSLTAVDDSAFLLATITVGNNPNGMALDAINNRLYVANSDDDNISVIDTSTLQELARVSLDEDIISASFKRDCEDPYAMAVDTFNGVPFVFTACFSSHAVVVTNAQTLEVVEVFPNTAL